MPATAEIPAEPTETTSSDSSNAGPLSLAQYASEVEELTGERVTNDIQPAEESENESPKLEPEPSKEEALKQEPEKKVATKPPAPKKVAPDFTDPQVQAEIDRRAAALERSRRDEATRAAAETARREERAEYEQLVTTARGPEYDEDAQVARSRLAEMASTQLLRESLYSEVAPVIRETIIEDVSAQFNQGYAILPEFGYQEVWDRLHHSRYDNAGAWLADVVNGISAIRVADKNREWTEKFDTAVKSRAQEMATGMAAEQLADYRAKQPNPDISSSITDGKEERRYRSQAELRIDIDKLLPKLGTAGYRALRESLPEE